MRKLSRKRAESVALYAFLMQAFLSGCTFFIAAWCKSQAAWASAWVLLLGLPVWLLSWLLLRQRRLAEEEAAEWERLEAERKAGGGERTSLFVAGEQEAFIAQTRLRQLEKYLLPTGSLIVAVLFGLLGALLFLARWREGRIPVAENANLGAALLLCESFILFLVGMYARGMARQAEWRPLRAGASFMMAGSLALCISGLGLAAWGLQFKLIEQVAALIIPALMVLTAVEILLNFILDFYRPRIPGQEARPSYDSRLLGLLTEPGGILRTAAATLDYQFGFKVSETWFYRFLERAIAPLLLFQGVAFYLLTCVLVVGPEQQAIIERWGRPIRAEASGAGEATVRVFGPGLHLKWPWPIERAYRFPALQVQEIAIGGEGVVEGAKFIWTQEHFKTEYHFLVATRLEEVGGAGGESEKAPPPVNMLAANIVVQYRVKPTPKGLYDFRYRVADTRALLEGLAYREATRYLAHVDLLEVMSKGRRACADVLKQRIQEAVDAENMGVDIVFVGLTNIHPPVQGEVGMAFERVVAAEEERVATVLQAVGYKNQQEYGAVEERAKILATARGEAFERVKNAEGERDRFMCQLSAYHAAPSVFPVREYLRALEAGLKDIRKYVLLTEHLSNLTIPIDLQEVKRPELFDVELGRPEEKREKGKEKK